MHRITLLLIAIVSLASCSDIEDNTPGLVAERDYELFDAQNVSVASAGTNQFAIQGTTAAESLTLVVPDLTIGTYTLGQGGDATAVYAITNQAPITTNDNPESNGSISITQSGLDGSVSGEFSFVAFEQNNNDTVYFRKGVFYQIPFTNGTVNPGTGATGTSLDADIDGLPLNPTITNAQSQNGTITITGGTTSQIITIFFPASITPGTYTLPDPSVSAGLFVGSTPATATSGTVTIDAIDLAAGTVSGTFDFTADPGGIQVTNGTFSGNF